MKLFRQLKKGDFVIFIIIIIIALSCFIPFISMSSDQLICEISQNDKLLHRIVLQDNFKDKFDIDTGKCTIRVENNSVWFEYSDCPDQVCVKTGKLSRAGQVAVCLPNHIIVKLIGEQNEIDAIVT